MKSTRYTKYTGDLASEIDLESLLEALSDYLLDSGYYDSFNGFQDLDHTMDDLREALRRVLETGDFFDGETRELLDRMMAEGTLDELIDKLMERMERENYVSAMPQNGPTRIDEANGQVGKGSDRENVRFEVTDKSLDFLGFKTLRDLMGSLGKSSFGRHDTRDWATGIETSGGSRRYEFGDTLNLDTTATLSSAIAREGLELPLNLEYDDLQVHQCDYQSSCATVVMLDCSHSMILYGEDRFFLGPNGAWKTTTLKMLAGLLYPTGGSARSGLHPVGTRRRLSPAVRARAGPEARLRWICPRANPSN